MKYNKSSFFEWFIMSIIFLNAITITMETTSLSDTAPMLFLTIDLVFMGIYLMEFVIKLYTEPLGYWKSYFNVFDFVIFVFAVMNSLLLLLNLGQTGLILLQVVKGTVKC